MSDTLTLRKGLWTAGYRPVAVKTNAKAPEGLDWQKRARQATPEAAIRTPSRHSLSTGILCDGLRAIDIDVADQGLADRIEAIIFELIGMGPVRTRSGTGKRLIVYAAIEGEPKKRYVRSDNGAVEVLGHGQQFVGYGTHPDGMDYEWRDGQDLVRIPRSDILTISEEMIGAVLDDCALAFGAPNEREREEAKAKPSTPTSVVPFVATETPSTGRFKRYAERTLDRIEEELASLSTGSRNATLNSSAMRMGGMAAHGWIDETTCRAKLLSACHSNGLAKEDGYAACEATFRSGWRTGLSRPAQIPEDSHIDDEYPGIVIALKVKTHAVTDAGDVYDKETGEVVYAAPSVAEAPHGLEDRLTHVPGLVGEITDWIIATARQPSRPLALAAALLTVGTLVGRRIAGPTGSGTHLYIMGLAPTASGKQHPQDCIARLMKAAGKTDYFGPPSFMSMSAMIRFLQRSPVSICCQDEYGAFLKRVNSSKADQHVRGISEVMRNVWGLSFQPYRTPEWASVASVEVGSIAFSLFGLSTPDELIGALSGQDVSNGFLNRFLVVDGGARAAMRDPDLDPRVVPDSLAQRLQLLPHGGKHVITTGADPEPQRSSWGSPAVKEIYDDLCRQCLVKIDAGPEGAYYGRVGEMALRMATIVAAGIDPISPRICEYAMRWAAEVAMTCTDWIAREAEARMTEELGAAQLEIKVRQRLARGPMKHRELHKALYRHVRNADDLKRVISAMQNAGVIQAYEVKPKNGGHTATTYALSP